MLRKSISTFCLIPAIVIAAAGSIWAAVPLSQVRSWQDGAPEAVSVTALSVDTNSETRPFGNGGSQSTTRVALTARVDAVHRTVSGLRPGAVIVVRYSLTFQTPPVPGIQQDIVLKIGDKAAAYLKRDNGQNYQLACAFGCLDRL